MNLFKRFTETIFLKTDSDLQKKVDVLTRLQAQYPANEKIKWDLTLYKLGLQGEREIEFELKNANLGLYVLHDVTLKYEDLTAQIDYVVVTQGKIYLIECKNMVGKITVNERGDFIREVNEQKEGIYSPIRQAERHVEVLKKTWLSKGRLLDKLFTTGRFDNWYVPLVVMANSKSVLNTRYAPKEYKNKIVRADGLVNYIKQDIATIDRDLLNSRKKMENIAQWILYLHTPLNEDYAKYTLAEEENALKPKLENLRVKLLEFRSEKAQKRKIPVNYIFTDNELEKILEHLPQSIEELKKLNIMPIKIKLHGEEIVLIVRNEMNLIDIK